MKVEAKKIEAKNREMDFAVRDAVRSVHLLYVFVRATLAVFMALTAATCVAYYGDPAKGEEHDLIRWGLSMAAALGVVMGLIITVFVIVWAKLAKFQYDGTWKEFRRKTRFLL